MKLKAVLIVFVFAVVGVACGKTTHEYSIGQKGDKGDRGDSGTGCTADEVSPSAEFPTGGVLINCSGTMTFLRDGANGSDATPVTTVKLCPGTTTYPSKFVEIAFCLQGKLYGTYSANGGFTTELPPGTYSSNAINSSCNFTVGANCAIQ